MKHYIFNTLIAVIFIAGCSSSDTPEMQTQQPMTQMQQASSGQLKYMTPDGWIPEQPASRMRAAQFSLPGVDGMAPAELAVFSGIGGSADDNIRRWYGQFSQPDGSSTEDKTETEELVVNGIPVTVISFTGTYLKSRSPMMMSGPVDELHGYAMIAAIAETPSGSWHFKATGPEKTINNWKASFNEFVQSFHIQ